MTLGSPAAWSGFVAFIVVMLALDLGVFREKTFACLKVALAFVLVFLGTKMALIDVLEVPIVACLGVIGTTLAASVLVSWLRLPTPATASPTHPS